ncbi:hypothetical protein [Streptomyces sp. NRRL F-2890]|uniref:hypothetical protein n=1 Tax=Streptomyces sp. NRRL F-2890 TaxID=1463845 RepID=UPI0004C86B15|nr:hypothetical protein [Streptomyces sp. NRRL F-2890]
MNVEALVPAHHQDLVAYIADRLPEHQVQNAEDLAQDTWMVVLSRGEPLEGAGSPGLPAALIAAAYDVLHDVLHEALEQPELLRFRDHHAPAPSAACVIEALPAPDQITRSEISTGVWWYTAGLDRHGRPAEDWQHVGVTVTRRGHWYGSTDQRNWLNNRVCRGAGCTASGRIPSNLDYSLPGELCPDPPTAGNIRAALGVPPNTSVDAPTIAPLPAAPTGLDEVLVQHGVTDSPVAAAA